MNYDNTQEEEAVSKKQTSRATQAELAAVKTQEVQN